MKIIKDSEKPHWAIDHAITCRRCTTQFAAETRSDFEDGYQSDHIYIRCPKCDEAQKVYKPWLSTKKYDRHGAVLCTVKSDPNTVMSNKSDGADWMGNYETQDEYFGK